MRQVAHLALWFSLSAFIGCNGSPAGGDASGQAGSSKSAAANTAGAAAEKPSGAAAEPKDPLADYTAVAASCDTSKKLGECLEYAELGMLEESLKGLCDAGGGTWAKDKACPKEGRVAVCAVTEGRNRRLYSKRYFERMKPDDVKSQCGSIYVGTYAEFPKGK